jgi:hypothetical protein
MGVCMYVVSRLHFVLRLFFRVSINLLLKTKFQLTSVLEKMQFELLWLSPSILLYVLVEGYIL